jgi:hypothetical protein
MFLPSIEKNTRKCGKGSKKNIRRENADLHIMLKIKGTNDTLTMDVQNT